MQDRPTALSGAAIATLCMAALILTSVFRLQTTFGLETISDTPAVSQNPAASVKQELVFDGKPYRLNPDITTICVIGHDRLRTTPTQGYNGQADFIAVVAIDPVHEKISVISIPRDTMVDMRRTYRGSDVIYDRKTQQICLAFSYGTNDVSSSENVCECVSDLLGGIPMNYFLTADESLVEKLTDTVGGVAVAYSADGSESETMTESAEVLDGTKALSYILWRDENKIGSAQERLRRQEMFLLALSETVKQTIVDNPYMAFSILETIESLTVTDLSTEDLFCLAGELKNLNAQDVCFHSLSGEIVHDASSEWEQFHVDSDSIDQVMADVFYMPS